MKPDRRSFLTALFVAPLAALAPKLRAADLLQHIVLSGKGLVMLHGTELVFPARDAWRLDQSGELSETTMLGFD